MTRLARLHVPSGLYFLVLRGNGGQDIFGDSDDYEMFSALVAKSLRRHRCLLHAFCWLHNRALLVVQISDIRIGRFVQHITGQYAKYLHGKLGHSGHLFEHHHKALLVQRSKYLLELIRYIHRAPIRAGIVMNVDDYAWSSHHAYLRERRIPWLTTYVARGMLSHGGQSDIEAYRQLISAADNPEIERSFERGHRSDPRVLGTDAFVEEISELVEQSPPDGALDEIIARVARAQGVTVESVLSPSRRRRHVLARALITWQATQSGIATLSGVASRLNRDPSTLWSAMERYRALRPELFSDIARWQVLLK